MNRYTYLIGKKIKDTNENTPYKVIDVYEHDIEPINIIVLEDGYELDEWEFIRNWVICDEQ